MRGTKANLIIRQGAEQKYKPVLYVERDAVGDAADARSGAHRGGRAPAREVARRRRAPRRRPVRGRRARDTTSATKRTSRRSRRHFLRYLRDGKLPEWEVPNMLVKYGTIMQAYEMSR